MGQAQATIQRDQEPTISNYMPIEAAWKEMDKFERQLSK